MAEHRKAECAHGGCVYCSRAELRIERDRYREALERIADAEKAETADARDWAVWAHDVAREALDG